MNITTTPTDTLPTRRTERWWLFAIALMTATYAAYFSALTCAYHDAFQTLAYDLGTFDQGIWLAGHSTDHFVTVRGLPLLGDHVRLFSFVLAPLYWIWDDVRALLIAQTVAIASGAVFLYLLGRRELPGHRFVVLALCASYLLHPAVQNLNLDHAHPDAFASTFILASVYFLRTERVVAFCVAAALAMSCKEDVPLVYVMLGAALAIGGRRKFGVALMAISAAYLLICTHVILPYFNHVGFFRLDSGYFGNFRKNLTNPAWFVDRLTSSAVLSYLWALGLPVVFASVLAPLSMLPALPALAANLLSDVGYMRSMTYHYATSIVPFLYVATLDVLRRPLATASRPRLVATLAAGAVLAGAIGANLEYSRASLAKLSRLANLRATRDNAPSIQVLYDLLARIPPDAAVSADYTLVPHLSHRQQIYMFPNPFKARAWGIINTNLPDPDVIKYIIVRSQIVKDDDQRRLELLIADGQFVRIDGDRWTGLYQRVSTQEVSPTASCGDWDGDGRVTQLDVLRILPAIMGPTSCPPYVCDVNGDGAVNMQDAMMLNRRAKGDDVTLRCPPREGRDAHR